MGFWQRIGDLFSRTKETKKEDLVIPLPPKRKVNDVEMPLTAGRVEPSNVNALLGSGELANSLTRQDYERLYYLAERDHDVSYATNNIVQMSSTPYTVKFGSEVKPKDAAAMMLSLKEIEPKLYDGGKVGLANAIIRQIAITGAISGEASPNDRLNGVKRVNLLKPERVLFVWDRVQRDYIPYQQNSIITDPYYRVYNHVDIIGYATRLNPLLYRYIPLDRKEESPYGIPPFLSALEAVCIENDMLANLSSVVRRMGLLGFLEVLLPAPPRGTYQDDNGFEQPESDESYSARMYDYLQRYAQSIETGLAKGYAVGLKRYDGDGNAINHSFNLQNSTSNAAGAVPLMELMMTVKSAGLKQDPIFLGKNFTTSEALAKVLINKFASQLENYQDLASQFIAHVYRVHLELAGFGKVNLEIDFEEPLLQDIGTKYEGLKAKFDFFVNMRNQGIINQQQLAQRMGEDAPANDPPSLEKEESTTNQQSAGLSFGKIVDRQRFLVKATNYKLKGIIDNAVKDVAIDLISNYELNKVAAIEDAKSKLNRTINLGFVQEVRTMLVKMGAYIDTEITQPSLHPLNLPLLPFIEPFISNIDSNVKDLDFSSSNIKGSIENALKSAISPYRSVASLANTYKNIYILNENNSLGVEKVGISDNISNNCCDDGIYSVKEALSAIENSVKESPLSLLKPLSSLISGRELELSNDFICRCTVYSK